jgi:uroporphyrinogen-III decarboxylase
MIRQIDLNARCAGHLSGGFSNDSIAAFPQSFVTEAEALGAAVHRTSVGFETVRCFLEEPEALFSLPRLSEAEPVRRVLEQMRGAPKDKILLLKANGPYSILASLIDPKHFYRWLVKHRAGIHRALDQITGGLTEYLCAAIGCGASIISLADPYASPRILGEKRYREFAAAPLVTLMKNVAAKTGGAAEKPDAVIHLCPHNSVPLTQLGYTGVRNIPVRRGSYIDALIRHPGFPPGLAILGDQCIYAQNTEKLVIQYLC